MKKIIYVTLTLAVLLLCSFKALKPEAKYLKKAEKSIEKGQLKEARNYYLKALGKSPHSYDANLGIGLMLCELMDNYSEAQPYLEKALNLSAHDTLSDLIYALGKCYQHNGEFEKAIAFFEKLTGYVDLDGEIDLGKELNKRKEDCRYALDHKYYPGNNSIFLVNAGRSINSEMPEYVPVLTRQNELIFTSKRKDNLHEQLNYLDGKYYESMYISNIDNSGFGRVRRYTLPDMFLRSHFHKYHESVLSLSPDGKKLFTYRDNKIFEININDRWRFKPRKLLKTINFDYYQNHAFVTKDGKTLYFTSDADGGYGGNDIYRSVKDANGNWGAPHNLGPVVNTAFDEEAPFVSDDGTTLFFSSRGHEGYGNFDVYKTYLADTSFTRPENLGEPINSSGNDLFMITDSASSIGYMSSSRNGGFGDMDIYKIIYIDKIKAECPTEPNAMISLSVKDESTADLKNSVELSVPASYKVVYKQWQINGETVEVPQNTLEKEYPAEGSYTVNSKIVALCDTCLTPVVSCNMLVNEIRKVMASPATPSDSADLVAEADPATFKGVLNEEQAKLLGLDLRPMLFDFNRVEVRSDAVSILTPNIEALKKDKNLKVEIVGYCDIRGSERDNLLISEMRARSIKNMMIRNGVSESQIIVAKGRGSQDLVNDCGTLRPCTEEDHQQNRRVVIIVHR